MGYGDIVPMNEVEMVLCTVFQLVNYIFVTIFVAELGPVIEEFGFRHLSRARQHRMLKHCFDCIHLNVREQVTFYVFPYSLSLSASACNSPLPWSEWEMFSVLAVTCLVLMLYILIHDVMSYHTMFVGVRISCERVTDIDGVTNTEWTKTRYWTNYHDPCPWKWSTNF